MKFHLYSGVILGAIFSISSCKKDGVEIADDASTNKEYLTEANQATDLLSKRLGSQLKAALQSGGPEAGIKVCQQVGQALTHSTSEELAGISVTRTSLKVRNPLNAPSAEDKEIMLRWQKQLATNGKLPESEVLQTDTHETVVYKPIITQQLCMKCHGDPSTFSPGLTSLLSEYYPNDQATGFTEGSLRGVFKVSFLKE